MTAGRCASDCVHPLACSGLDKCVRQNPPMPQTNKEKQESYRARQTLLGMTEVRGIFLPPDQHADLKAMAAKLRKKIDAARPQQRA